MTHSTIGEAIVESKTTLLVPAYFNCNSTCPLLAENLKNMILSSDISKEFKVLFLSFNSEDSPKTMKLFRKHHGLPPEWVLGVIENQGTAKDFLAQFQYSFQKTANGFDHPNAAFVFSPDRLVWTGSLYGVDNTKSELEKAYQDAALVKEKGVGAGFQKLVRKKEYLILFGLVGTVLPLLYLFWFFTKRRRSSVVTGLNR